MYSGGFVRLDEEAFKHSSDGPDWTDQETLMLLEGIEMYDEDWNKVAEHVGTRSKEQCVMHFLQLPIEDEYLEGGASGGTGVGVDAGAGAVSSLSNIPFAKSENPVMSVVAFLASAVGPGVAAAAAQSALGELTAELAKKGKKSVESTQKDTAGQAVASSATPGDKEEEQHSEKTGEEKDENMGKTETEADKMEVDGDTSQESTRVAATTSTPQIDSTSTDAQKSVFEAAETKPANEPLLESTAMEKVAALALGAAAAKASTLATHEERHIQSLVSRLISAQMKKLELKMSMFEKFEDLLEQEKRQLEIQKQHFFKEKLSLQTQLKTVQDLLKKAEEQGREGAAEGLKAANAIEDQLAPTTQSEMKEVTETDAEIPTDGAILPLQ